MARISLGLLLLLGLTRAFAADCRCEFVDPPRDLPAGQPATVRVRFALPAGATLALHVELKNAEAVLTSQTKPVTGEGVAEFSLAVPSSAREVFFAAWMGDDWQKSPCGVVNSPTATVLTAAESAALARGQARAAELREGWRRARTATGLVALFQAPEGEWPAAVGDGLARRFAAAGYGVVRLAPEDLANAHALTRDALDLLVIVDVRTVPAGAAVALSRYLDAGGAAMLLGGPAFEQALFPLDGRWLSYDDYRTAVARGLSSRVFADFEREAGTWTRNTNHGGSPGSAQRVTPGAHGSAGALEVRIANLTGWDTYESPTLPQPFRAGDTWTTFWAKGDSTTRETAVEWREQDGSRWIATVPISGGWRPYALPPDAFRFWDDPRKAGRGKGGDRFNPEHAQSLSVGLAFTHTHSVGGGPHSFQLDDLGTAPAPAGDVAQTLAARDASWPRIETVSPSYKLFPVTNLNRLRVNPGQALAPAAALPTPGSTLAPHPRPQGTGLHKGRAWRFVPLAESLDSAGKVCAAPVSLLISGSDPAHGGVVVNAPVTDPAFFTAPATADWLVALARRVTDGVMLYEGGTPYYASYGNEDLPLGAVLRHRGRADAPVTLVSEVLDERGRVVHQHTESCTLPAGTSREVGSTWHVPASGSFTVRTTLRRGEQVLDTLSHPLRVWQPAAQPHWLTVRDGGFEVDGKPWYAHGVNYMPTTGIGIEDGRYFELWLDAAPYDPDVIERDLTDVQAIGFNCVSVFIYHDSKASRNLLDLLMRCRDHGLKVNLSLRPGTPLDFHWDLMKDLVETYRLAENDTVFAYDLAWEPAWGNQERRRPYDSAWAKWITERYGSLEAAERAWGVPVPRGGGQVTSPTDVQARTDGPWGRMVNDYRRFLNGLLDSAYGKARTLMRSVDPRHLVSFRMSIAGDPGVDPASMGYDFAGLAKAVDLLEPEGYGVMGDWNKTRSAVFTVAYGRAVAPGLPVMWAEFGNSIWSGRWQGPTDEGQQRAAGIYEQFYRAAQLAAANGTIAWWLPGGYRWNERSDFGVLNPDRSWRPVTEVIHQWAPSLTAPRPLPRPDLWLEFDPEHHNTGIRGVYEDVQAAFWQAIAEGKRPGLRRRGQGPGAGG